ncbi:hypothetical protein I8748_23580 [Nostoc sp. CENA67]|uniref:Uncharacterized protein n=1 Tax=Amazonocrinis nigriterrae CENA67 TaxID=2794033 RepID=A0A8J7HXF5_9NOST|nr:hypothetical protein [Amazonocrinis nigriterrae]MBH8565127.1 hypothetical protein [Amazonocrinis nigriterrae CENA67]
MANITLTELHTTGSELFQDSESFLNELNNLDSISGGDYSTGVSDFSTIIKLAESFVDVYAINNIAFLAKSFSHSNSTGY